MFKTFLSTDDKVDFFTVFFIKFLNKKFAKLDIFLLKKQVSIIQLQTLILRIISTKTFPFSLPPSKDFFSSS